MKVLKQISDKQAQYYRYQAREDYLRLQESLLDDLEQVKIKSKQDRINFEQEKTRLLNIIRKAGIDPNE